MCNVGNYREYFEIEIRNIVDRNWKSRKVLKVTWNVQLNGGGAWRKGKRRTSRGWRRKFNCLIAVNYLIAPEYPANA